MLFRVGPGSSGYNWFPEYIDWDCVLTLAGGAGCPQGQVLCRDVTQVPSNAGADMVVLPTSPNAGPVYGVYQGPAITNPAGQPTQTYQIIVRIKGQGVLSASASTVGAQMINTAGTLPAGVAPTPEEIVPGTFVGTALATGTATAPGAAIPAGLQACAISV